MRPAVLTQSRVPGCVTSWGSISHDTIQLLAVTTDFTALTCFTGNDVFVFALFPMGVESGAPLSANF